MEKEIEHRTAFRMPFNTKVICHVNGNDFQGKISNLSASGLFMKATKYPPPDSQCEIEIILNGTHSRLRIEKIKGVIVRTEEQGAGIEFDDRLEWIALIPIYFHKIQEEQGGKTDFEQF